MRSLLPPPVVPRIDGYLDAADEAVPGLVIGLYITGSIALDDYQPAISDIDAVALCSGRPDAGECAALADVHAQGPKVDVLYATAEDMATDPATLSLPCSSLGEFKQSNAFAANPVEWRTLATKAIAVRGRTLDPATIWFDADALRRWNLANLDDYCVVKTGEGERIQPEFWARWESGLQWVVLGITRLHHTIATNEVTKSAAGAYALGITDERWHDVVRAGSPCAPTDRLDSRRSPRLWSKTRSPWRGGSSMTPTASPAAEVWGHSGGARSLPGPRGKASDTHDTRNGGQEDSTCPRTPRKSCRAPSSARRPRRSGLTPRRSKAPTSSTTPRSGPTARRCPR